MRRTLSRLRWQLTLSHLVAIAVTLVSMIAAVLFIASAWWTHNNDPSSQPAEDARAVATSVEGLVRPVVAAPDGSPAQTNLNAVLALIRSGQLSIVSGAPVAGPGAVRSQAPTASSLPNLAYIVIVGTDDRVLASSEASGAAFAPPERADWTPLVNSALGGTTDTAQLRALRSEGQPAALGAYPILGETGRPIAAAVVATTAVPVPSTAWDFWQALLFFGAATLVVLAAASLLALMSSSVVSYFLSRRLVSRLERLGRAAESLSTGDLTRRVGDLSRDELGELGRTFDSMADRLSQSVAELAAEKQTVEATLQAKRELVANVSHELRTPLASIRGHTESLLLRQPDTDELHQYLQVIHRQTEQLSRLIDDLFLLSTTEAGALPLVARPLALGEVVEEVVRSIQPAALHERQVRLFASVSPDVPVVVADRQRVAQVLSNLVRNAVRYTPEGGLVAVRASRCAVNHHHFGWIVVEDTGPGIPPEELQHVFERFYRADASRERGSGGAGLGLAIVRELVTAMGGDVSAESVPGEGSRFSFTLPVADPDGQPVSSRCP